MSDFLIPYPICMALFSGKRFTDTYLPCKEYNTYSVSIGSIWSILILEITKLSILNQIRQRASSNGNISQGDFTLHMLP